MSAASRRPIVIATIAAGASLAITVLIALKIWSSPRGEDASPLRGGKIESASEVAGAPPVLLKLPDFKLTERSGEPAGSRELRGKVWIADFIFTSCAGPCPLMSTQMAALQKRLASSPGWGDTRLVSISVDPERDTPEALTKYAATYDADPTHWLFLTGQREEIWSLIRNGFKLHVGEAEDNTDMPILHSEKFVLIDRGGRIRGFYDGLESEERDRLITDAAEVLGEPMSEEVPATQPR